MGPAGVGKSFMAQALGFATGRAGYAVRYIHADDFFKTMNQARLPVRTLVVGEGGGGHRPQESGLARSVRPHSYACFVKAYPAETTEAFCDGHGTETRRRDHHR